MCYWLIYIIENSEFSKLEFQARPFENLEKLHQWLENTEHIIAITITRSIYKDD